VSGNDSTLSRLKPIRDLLDPTSFTYGRRPVSDLGVRPRPPPYQWARGSARDRTGIRSRTSRSQVGVTHDVPQFVWDAGGTPSAEGLPEMGETSFPAPRWGCANARPPPLNVRRSYSRVPGADEGLG
jgi:hypothetical protein